MSKKNTTKITRAMKSENAAQLQTKWIQLGSKVVSFHKRHLPDAPEGEAKYAHFVREQSTGQAYRFETVEKMPRNASARKSSDVEINGVVYAFYKIDSENAFGVLVSETGLIKKLVRDSRFDIEVES